MAASASISAVDCTPSPAEPASIRDSLPSSPWRYWRGTPLTDWNREGISVLPPAVKGGRGSLRRYDRLKTGVAVRS